GASMFAALAAFGNAGGILMPWMVGWIADLKDLHWGLAFSALAPLLMMPVLAYLYRGVRRPFIAPNKLPTTA
ncbi:MAG: MFS transporter, partial [Verrucomicrobia bacterium]|nr:MFS transporter [Verrucomicrobiota bacterium]